MSFDFDKLDRAQQKHRLIREFGMLLGPLKVLAEKDSPPSRVEYIGPLQTVRKGASAWWTHARAFTSGLGALSEKLTHVFWIYPLELSSIDPRRSLENIHTELRETVENLETTFFELIEMVPLEWGVTLSEAESPFTFYMRVLDAASSVKQRLHYFDRYLKSDFFDLYLRNLSRDLEIRLVTIEGRNKHGVIGVRAVSELARQEFHDYQLLQVGESDMHDRNLRVDDKVFTLGTSATEAGKQPTHFGEVDQAANAVLDELLAKGTVIHRSSAPGQLRNTK